ncbi:MAG: Rrf2 family transcriptional regulator [Deltaproteobacteria bacterium]|jgi:DNA-binding IscR family transcriptional regulator
MNVDTRLSGVTHVLLHLAQVEEAVSSEVLAKSMGTNPVVVRRVMAGLRERGYVQSTRGPGGGWVLCCDLAELTLRDVHEALGSPTLLAIGHRTSAPDCLVEAAVNTALGGAFREAEARLLERLGEVTLSMLHAYVRGRLVARQLDETCQSAKASRTKRSAR